MGRRLLGVVQKAIDRADYPVHRARMRLTFHANRVRHRIVFRHGLRSILVVRIASIGDVSASDWCRCGAEATYGMLGSTSLLRTRPYPAGDCQSSRPQQRARADGSLLLDRYDWIINLQNRPPPDSFLQGTGLTFPLILERLSTMPGCRFVTGRHVVRGREVTSTNVLYCLAVMEEYFLTALESSDRADYPATAIVVEAQAQHATESKFQIPHDRPALAIFLGSNSVGCGADEGFVRIRSDFWSGWSHASPIASPSS